MSVLLMPNCTSYLHNADCFSRLPIGNDPTFKRYRSQNSVVNVVQESWLTSLPISAEEVRKATEEDHVLQKVIEQIKNGWPKMRKKVSSFVLFFISVWINTLHLRCSVWADRVGDRGVSLRQFLHLMMSSITCNNTLFVGDINWRAPLHNMVELEKHITMT